MKAGPLLALVAAALALDCNAGAQAIASTVQLTQQSMSSTKSASQQQSVRINSSGASQSGPAKSGKSPTFYDINRPPVDCHCASQPVLSEVAGEVSPGTKIAITSADPDAVLYYTTDGWTPTEASNRYTDPIPILATTRLQVFAITPKLLPSSMIEATYTVNAPAAPLPSDAFASGSVMVKGTRVRLITASRINSRTASVGDRIYVLLDQNIFSDGTLVARKGVSVDAKIVKVERAANSGKSGVLALQLESLNVRGTTVPLKGIYTLAGPDVAKQTQHIANPSMVHVAGPLPPGNESEIEPGMTLIATVATDTRLNP